MSVKKILLIHLFSNGDCLYATTVARQIKQDFPGCHLTWAISTQCKAIIANNPYVDEVMEISMPANKLKEECYNDTVKEANKLRQQGLFDEIFETQVIEDNWVNYDSCVRTSIYRCYGRPITVEKRPILVLTNDELNKAEAFAVKNNLSSYKHVVLYECAPLSGQANFSDQFVMELAEKVVAHPQTAIILSSGKSYPIQTPGVMNGNTLTIRETVALARYCNLMISCSSGIFWAISSQSDIHLPAIQLLNKHAYVYNPPSIAKAKVGEGVNDLIEFFDYDLNSIDACIQEVFANGFPAARRIFHQPAKKQFRLYRGITHELIKKRKFSLLKSFIRMNLKENNWNPKMLWAIMKGIFLFPIQEWMNSRKKS